MDIIIRPLQASDKKVFQSLYKRTVVSEFPEYSQRVLRYFSEGKFASDMWQSPFKFGAFIDKTLVGYMLSDSPIGGVVFLHWLVIDPPYHRKGIGRKLLIFYEEFIKTKGAHNIHILVDEKNIPFYEKCGYEVYGFDDKSYFGSKDYLMRKIIQDPQEDTFFQ